MRRLRLCWVGVAGLIACSSPSGTADGGAPLDAGVDAGVPPVPSPAFACAWPTTAMAGEGPLAVTVYGGPFGADATGFWNGAPRPTTVLDGGVLEVTLSADDLAAPANAWLGVSNTTRSGDAGVAFAVLQPLSRRRIPTDGLYTQIERRGALAEYWTGELLQQWNILDPLLGQTPAQEAQLELDAMRAMGVNALTLELRTADGGGGPFVPPGCPIPGVLGLQYPQPQAEELSSLRALLDLAQSEGMKVWLRLPNTYQQESPPLNNAVWLGAALGAVQGHPAIDLVLFDGAPHVYGGQCGIPAEPPLWDPASGAAAYVQWAVGFALDAGWSPRQLSAEEVVGSYVTLHSSNLVDPVVAMKGIFDALGIPPGERTYAISMYEASRCQTANGLPCIDERPDAWAEETLRHVWDVVGRCSGSRVVAPEMGSLPPFDGGWRFEWSVENLGELFERYGTEGGSYWLWVHTSTDEDFNPSFADAVKYRGTAFSYAPVQKEILDLGMPHLSAVPNGSFERGDGGVDAWTTGSGDGGSATRYWLAAEPGQPRVLTRGDWTLRLDTGGDLNGSAWADSARLPLLPDAGYVLTSTLRFVISGDPDAGAPPPQRPQVRLSVRYFTSDGGFASRVQDDLRLFQENSVADFATFNLPFRAPSDATQAQVELAVQRSGAGTPLVADFDNVR